MTSPSTAKLAVTPPYVGLVSTEMYGQARLGVPARGGARLGHLHEREHAFLHARAARRGDDARSGSRSAVASSKARAIFSPTTRAHRRADEAEVHRAEHERVPVDASPAGDDRLGQAALLGGGHELVRVGLDRRELERIARHEVGVDLGEAALVGEQLDALRARSGSKWKPHVGHTRRFSASSPS